MNILIFLICFFILLLYLIYKFTTKKKESYTNTTPEVFGIDLGDFYKYYKFTTIDPNGILLFENIPLTVYRLNLLLPDGYKVATLSNLQDATFNGGMQHYTWGICQGTTDNYIRGVCPVQSPLLTTVNNPYASRLITITSISQGSTITSGYNFPIILWIYGVKPTNDGSKSIPIGSLPTQDNGAGFTLKTDYSNSMGRKIYNWYNPLPGETKVPSAWSFKDGVGPLTSDSCMYPLQTTINNEIYYLNYDSDSSTPTFSLSKSISPTPWIYNSSNKILIFEYTNGNFDVLMGMLRLAFDDEYILGVNIEPLGENKSNINDLLPPQTPDDLAHAYKINFNSDGTIVFVDKDPANENSFGIYLKAGDGPPFTALNATADSTKWLKFKQIKWSDMGNKPAKQPTGTVGQMCVVADYGTTFSAQAPVGTHFTKLLFGDYGQPTRCLNSNSSSTCSASSYNYDNCCISGPFPEKCYYADAPPQKCCNFSSIINENKFNGLTINGSKTLSILVNDTNMGFSETDPLTCQPNTNKWFTAVLEYVYE
jgi:hypothetical protein